MKSLITAAILTIGLSAFAAPEVFGPRDVDIKLGELALLPVGLNVTHAPETVWPTFVGPSGADWLHGTTVSSRGGPVTIVEYGFFVDRDGHWDHAHGLDRAYTGEEFAELFGCPDALVEPGVSYTFDWNRSLMDGRGEQAGLWYFIGVDADGQRVKGEATVTLRQDGTELCFSILER